MLLFIHLLGCRGDWYWLAVLSDRTEFVPLFKVKKFSLMYAHKILIFPEISTVLDFSVNIDKLSIVCLKMTKMGLQELYNANKRWFYRSFTKIYVCLTYTSFWSIFKRIYLISIFNLGVIIPNELSIFCPYLSILAKNCQLLVWKSRKWYFHP